MQARFNVQKYSLSANGEYLLLVHDVRVVNTFSYTAKYQIYETKNSYSKPLVMADGSQDLQYAAWGPIGSQLVN